MYLYVKTKRKTSSKVFTLVIIVLWGCEESVFILYYTFFPILKNNEHELLFWQKRRCFKKWLPASLSSPKIIWLLLPYMTGRPPAPQWKAIPNNVFLRAAESFPLSLECSGTKAKEELKPWTDVRNWHWVMSATIQASSTTWVSSAHAPGCQAQLSHSQCCSNTLFRLPERAVLRTFHIYPLKLQREMNKKGRRIPPKLPRKRTERVNWGGLLWTPGERGLRQESPEVLGVTE